jgi:hypothetical protein
VVGSLYRLLIGQSPHIHKLPLLQRRQHANIAKRTLNDITTYHIWKGRCNKSYEGITMPPVIVANEIWVEFTNTIKARINHIKAKATWWSYRDENIWKKLRQSSPSCWLYFWNGNTQ